MGKFPILVWRGSWISLWQLIVIAETFAFFFLFKDYQHNNQRILKENQAQIQMTYTILIEKLNSSFYHT